MNKNIAISIIIPIYNLEKYLAECLNSCINQTLKNIEIICVNDCTPDNSRSIAENFAKRDTRIKIIDHEINKGLGAARNTGVKHANGEYIWFVDSDDFIAENACQLLYDTAKQHDVEVLCFDAIEFINEPVDSLNRIYREPGFFNTFPKCTTFSVKEMAEKIDIDFSVTVWQYITKREYIKNFSFRENCFWEDNDFTIFLFASCNAFRYLPFTAYYYRRSRKNSVTLSTYSEKSLLDLFAVCTTLEAFIKQNNLSKKHFVFRLYDYIILSTQEKFLCNKEIVENSKECKQALEKIMLIVKQVKFRKKLNDFKTGTLRRKLSIIYRLVFRK